MITGKEVFAKSLLGKNGTPPLGDRFYCEKSLRSILKRKEKDLCVGERKGTVVLKQALKK